MRIKITWDGTVVVWSEPDMGVKPSTVVFRDKNDALGFCLELRRQLWADPVCSYPDGECPCYLAGEEDAKESVGEWIDLRSFADRD